MYRNVALSVDTHCMRPWVVPLCGHCVPAAHNLNNPRQTERSESLVLQFLFIVSEKADRTYEKNCKSMSNKLTKNGG